MNSILRLVGCALIAMNSVAPAAAYEELESLTCVVIIADMDRPAQEALQKELAGSGGVRSSDEIAKLLTRQDATVRAVGALRSRSGVRAALAGRLAFEVDLVLLPSEGDVKRISLDGGIQFEGRKVVLVGAGEDGARALRDGEARVLRFSGDESRVAIVRVIVEPLPAE